MNQHRDAPRSRDPNSLPGVAEKPVIKKPYTAPVLVEYGTIAKLTQGTLTVNFDSGFGNSRRSMMCL